MNTKSLTYVNPTLDYFLNGRLSGLKPSPLLNIKFLTPTIFSGKDVTKTSEILTRYNHQLSSALTGLAETLDLPALKARSASKKI